MAHVHFDSLTSCRHFKSSNWSLGSWLAFFVKIKLFCQRFSSSWFLDLFICPRTFSSMRPLRTSNSSIGWKGKPRHGSTHTLCVFPIRGRGILRRNTVLSTCSGHLKCVSASNTRRANTLSSDFWIPTIHCHLPRLWASHEFPFWSHSQLPIMESMHTAECHPRQARRGCTALLAV